MESMCISRANSSTTYNLCSQNAVLENFSAIDIEFRRFSLIRASTILSHSLTATSTIMMPSQPLVVVESGLWSSGFLVKILYVLFVSLSHIPRLSCFWIGYPNITPLAVAVVWFVSLAPVVYNHNGRKTEIMNFYLLNFFLTRYFQSFRAQKI